MKRIIIVTLILVLPLLVSAADQRGLTGIDPYIQDQPVQTELATLVSPGVYEPPKRVHYLSPWLQQTDDWELIAADSICIMIPDGGHLAVSFDPLTETLEIIDPTVELSAIQMEAVERAPAWLRADLYDNFRRFLYSFLADSIALRVLGAPDPYVDEVAFLAAHTAPTTLCGMYYQLLLENAEDIYAVDSTLNYVEIVDYGSSGDDDYWTTCRYTVIEESGDTIEVEIDREIYYWHIVHPKLSDEFPTYINPANGNPTPPPTGVFWRDYLWNHADPGYPLYSEQFGDCDFLWDRTNASNDAISTVTDWINSVMTFGAGAERPIQPVRIYVLHCGNCGEFSDITAAAGRIALIPTVCTTNFCEDHTWNEFWEREWIHWEPVNNYVNNPLVYENGWGKVISAVFNWRGDGYVWNVTDRYSEGVCTLNVSVYDSEGKPADSYSITIESDALWGGSFYATWAVTSSLGQASIVLGDAQSFSIRIEGPLGNFPAMGGTVTVITGSQAGATYEWEHSVYLATPALGVSQAPEYPNPDDNYLMEIVFDGDYEAVYGRYYDINEFSEKLTPGYADFFLANEENYTEYCSLAPAQGFSIEDNTASGSISFVLPTAETWYGVLSTREISIVRPMIDLMVNVYRSSVPDVAVTLTPYDPPITVPASGGDFDFNVAIANNEAGPVTFDAWIMVQLPDSIWFGPVLGPADLTLESGAMLDRDRAQNVPGGAPAGIYTYEARLGVYPDEIWDSDSFTFEKTAAGTGSAFTNWLNSGEDFEVQPCVSTAEIPTHFDLKGAYPNPFNQETVISFNVPAMERVKIAVYNLMGQEVALVADRVYSPGEYNVRWNAQEVTSGIYLIRMIAPQKQFIQKVCFMQ